MIYISLVNIYLYMNVYILLKEAYVYSLSPTFFNIFVYTNINK